MFVMNFSPSVLVLGQLLFTFPSFLSPYFSSLIIQDHCNYYTIVICLVCCVLQFKLQYGVATETLEVISSFLYVSFPAGIVLFSWMNLLLLGYLGQVFKFAIIIGYLLFVISFVLGVGLKRLMSLDWKPIFVSIGYFIVSTYCINLFSSTSDFVIISGLVISLSAILAYQKRKIPLIQDIKSKSTISEPKQDVKIPPKKLEASFLSFFLQSFVSMKINFLIHI